MNNGWDDKAKKRKAVLALHYQAMNGEVSEEIKEELMSLYLLEDADDQKKFGENLTLLSKHLYSQDPIGIVKEGVSEEEYDCEARMILRELEVRENLTLKQINEIVHEIFAMQFTFDCAGAIDRPCYRNISQEIYKNFLNKNK